MLREKEKQIYIENQAQEQQFKCCIFNLKEEKNNVVYFLNKKMFKYSNKIFKEFDL